MLIFDPACVSDHQKMGNAVIVIEEPRKLQDDQGEGLNKTLDRLVVDIGASGSGDTVLGMVVRSEQSLAHTVNVYISHDEPVAWLDSAERVFPNSRYFTTEERAEIREINRAMVRPLSKPLKKL